jgi:hypothetical protein
MPAGAQNDAVPFARQCKLESLEENIFFKLRMVRCGNAIVVERPINSVPTSNPDHDCRGNVGQFPSAIGSR